MLPWGSKPTQLQVRAFKSHHIRCIGRNPIAIDVFWLFNFYFIHYCDTAGRGFEPHGVSDLVTLAMCLCKTTK